MDPLEFTSTNLLVKAFAPDDLAALIPSFTRVELERGKPLIHSGRQVTHVYFPEGSIASVIGGEPDAPTEIGLIGRDGMTGVSVLLGGGSASLTTFIQVNGSTALCLEADVMRGQFAKSAALRALMLRYVHTFMMQIASCVVSNAHQRMEARLARFLLMSHDRVDGDEIALTHEFMSLMVASQRPGVTLTLHELEGAGLIRSTRGKVTVLDRAKLTALAGITYGQPEAEYRRLIGDFGK
jgi:CRP-like cAMP-binding protein